MENKLEKKYGLFTAICMVVGIVVGSGVFFKAQVILQKTGGDMPLGVLAWLIGGVVILRMQGLKMLSDKNSTPANEPKAEVQAK